MYPPSSPRRQPSSQSTSSRDSGSRTSNDSYGSHGSRSTAPTSYSASPRPSDIKAAPTSARRKPEVHRALETSKHYKGYAYGDDVSPDTSLCPRSSADTYASTTASSQDLSSTDGSPEYNETKIPPLPVYRREVVEPNVRASTPQDFAKLFPSLNRLTIRHDEFTPDGNMNLRIDTTVVAGRRRTAIQLFHLRMYDLAKREFSLRRYCRDSGREVCNSKRKYIEPSAAKHKTDDKPTLKRSMSTALRTLSGAKPVLRRAKSGAAMTSSGRPDSGYSSGDGDDDIFGDRSNLSRLSLDSRLGKAKSQRVPTNTIKLEFSNYARVDVHRRGKRNNKRYEFEWWGHKYSWKRSVDKHLGGLVSFHLLRDGNSSAPVAHIVPEARSPSQVLADETAGGWVPPCLMWIADETVVTAVTDVADVIMASGLMALVDDCIKERWQTKKVHHIPVPLTSKTVNFEHVGPKAIMQHFFGRRHTNEHHLHSPPSSPLRFGTPIAAY